VAAIALTSTPAEPPVQLKPLNRFEWVPHGDPSARRRARAHVTRGFRRQKALAQQSEATDRSAKGNNRASERSPSPYSPESVQGEYFEVANSKPIDNEGEYIAVAANQDRAVLQTSLLGNWIDPFDALPVSLCPDTKALLEHCRYFPHPFVALTLSLAVGLLR
jgi:hypothetical protein